MNTQTMSIGPDDLVEIEQVGGDLEVRGSEGAELQAHGEQVRLERRAGSLTISCGGDLSLIVPRSAHLLTRAVGGDVHLDDLAGNVELGAVGGDAILRNLSGTVQLNGLVGGDTRMENVASISMDADRRGGPGLDFAQRIRETVEKATRRAESSVRRAESRVRRAEGRAYRYGHASVRWGDSAESAAAAPAGDPVSDEERMAILKMLQDKKITSEQADQLLSALEGNA